ncbi:Hypothetical_protein [Hexamita inflata]|uniref:Hypothetical_protein n=1 Tax=Hexamita inflata TaxID=28002 RepID=A0AA86P3E0_9EUKA|nr:Hypothetical protein HINF_LOCUS18146 [Hexamita inflata]CAI9930510.1 Hypothetical protein HINF_LOCUS18155 [Hexamita inflata]
MTELDIDQQKKNAYQMQTQITILRKKALPNLKYPNKSSVYQLYYPVDIIHKSEVEEDTAKKVALSIVMEQNKKFSALNYQKELQQFENQVDANNQEIQYLLKKELNHFRYEQNNLNVLKRSGIMSPLRKIRKIQ